MKKLFFITILTPILIFSQKSSLKSTRSDVFGDPVLIVAKNPIIKGTKYIYEEWSEGYLVINDSIFSYQNKILLDQSNGDLIINPNLDSNETGFVITDRRVTGFVINKKISVQKRTFIKLSKSHFIGKNVISKFYEVISNMSNTNFLIKDTQKYIFDPNRSKGVAANNDFQKEYKARIKYFIKNKGGKYAKVKLNKKSILKVLKDKGSEVKAYASSKKISFNKEHDVVRILNYYHTL